MLAMTEPKLEKWQEALNSSLCSTYQQYLPQFELALNQLNTIKSHLSYPLLVNAFPEYFKSRIKLFIVGQQTKGWSLYDSKGDHWYGINRNYSPDDLIRRLLDVYKGFNLGQNYYNSPFWRSSHRLYCKLNPSGPEYGFLWSNLIRIDQDQRRLAPDIEESVCNVFPILQQEIELAKPDVLIFFTGPNYDSRLENTFNGLTYGVIKGYALRTLARIQHNDLPTNSFRTYHPGYLTRSLTKEEVDGILSKIAELGSS